MHNTRFRFIVMAAGFLIFGMVSTAQAIPTACEQIGWRPGSVHTINVSKEFGLHIMLPHNLNATPVLMNKALWKADGAGTHIFVKPDSDQRQGKQTSITAIDVMNNSYTFILNRSSVKNAQVCITIGLDSDFFNSHDKRNILDQNQAMQSGNPQQLLATIADMESGQSHEIDRNLANYRSKIFTGYRWSKGDDQLIQDVYDDGRFSFVRLDEQPAGVMAIMGAVTNGQEEILDFSFDAPNNLYQISGVYETIWLRYDEREVRVDRKRN